MSTRKRFMRSKPSGWKQVEAVRIEAQTNGQWDVRVEGRSHPYTGVGGTWLDADNQPGEDAILGFIQGNPLLPFFFSRGSRPNAAYVARGTTPGPTITYTWSTLGANSGLSRIGSPDVNWDDWGTEVSVALGSSPYKSTLLAADDSLVAIISGELRRYVLGATGDPLEWEAMAEPTLALDLETTGPFGLTLDNNGIYVVQGVEVEEEDFLGYSWRISCYSYALALQWQTTLEDDAPLYYWTASPLLIDGSRLITTTHDKPAYQFPKPYLTTVALSGGTPTNVELTPPAVPAWLAEIYFGSTSLIRDAYDPLQAIGGRGIELPSGGGGGGAS